MQNKKLYIIFSVVVILVAVAAFVGGQLLNGGVGPLGLFPMMGGGPGTVSISIEMTPAPELPKTEPETRGVFVERKDNTIVIQEFSMEMGKGGGGVVVQAGSGEEGGPMNSGGPGDSNGPKVEVVITSKTIIYRDATEMPTPSEVNETQVIQQVVEEGTLDDLTSNSMIMVWGRKNGDRIIADMIVYSQPVMFKREVP
ncbi:MAG: hypothetical protein HYZ22_10505 [Chloroflexi bacterium]|nr:hypothetical protein [Chloroflexota bacterium]